MSAPGPSLPRDRHHARFAARAEVGAVQVLDRGRRVAERPRRHRPHHIGQLERLIRRPVDGRQEPVLTETLLFKGAGLLM